MAFTKKTWVDRNTQYPTRRTLTAVAGVENTYEVTRAEGTVTTEGDAFNASNMNDLENRINDSFYIATGTLTAGSTEITITNPQITSDDVVISIFTEKKLVDVVEEPVVNPTAHTIKLVFDAQESNMKVGVMVEGTF